MDQTQKFLQLQLNELFEALTKIFDTLKTQKNLPNVRAKLKRVEELKTQYDTLRKEILKFNSETPDPKMEIKTNLEAFNGLFDGIYARYYELMGSNCSQAPSPTPTVSPNITLQPIELPKFDGSIERWTQFKSLFDSLIHNNKQIPDIQKLHYLRAHVVGEAAGLIQNYSMEERNYTLSYETLDARYSSPRRLLNFYLGRILNITAKEARDYGHLHSTLTSAVLGLKNITMDDPLDCVLLHLCYRILTPLDRQHFDNSCDPSKVPSTNALFEFLRRRVHTNDFHEDLSNKTTIPSSSSQRQLYKKPSSLVTTRPPFYLKCGFCSESHKLYGCPEFLKMPQGDRKKWILSNNRCIRCLGSHSETQCGSKGTCKECSSPDHHSLLHEPPSPTFQVPQCNLARSTSEAVLLGTIKLRVKNAKNEWVQVRGILDSASQLNLISAKCAQQLQLSVYPSTSVLAGVASNRSQIDGHTFCEVDIGKETKRCNFAVLRTICPPQPNFIVTDEVRLRFKNYKLADDDFCVNKPIDLLLGAELFSDLISNDGPNFIPGKPAALKTPFGYVLMGKVESSRFAEPLTMSITNDDLSQELRRFWETEQVNFQTKDNPEDTYCEDFFNQTVSRNSSGRYQVRLPIKPGAVALTNNRASAFASYKYLEQRLLKDPELKHQYDQFLLDYLKLDFMDYAKVPATYLHTHHSVLKDSSSTALRVVFNGSTPDSRGNSLNSNLLPGPKLQKTLPDILDNFRSHPFVLMTDIAKMFNQILLHPDDRIYQHIFWRPPQQPTVQEFELKRLSFGHVSSPWLALRVLKQLVIDEGANYPRAATALTNWTYIDDIITGVDSVDEGKTLIRELTELLNKGGFHLKKWISNSKELLRSLQDGDLEIPRNFKDDSPYFKVLGVSWLPGEDAFSFKTVNFESPTTKRNIVSYTARLFDPCGWCSPVILKAKLFIQQTWLLGVDWDEDLPTPFASQWEDFVAEFHYLTELKIPRHIGSCNNRYRLLGFCDGSSDAYGCCVYLQNTSLQTPQCFLLRAKSKVCPLRTLSIPRIELQAAHLLVKLVKSIRHELFPFAVEEIFYFTDSEIVLHWLGSSPHLLKTFVANRVSEILELTTPTQWRHVKSQDNPSDPISRGLRPKQLLDCTLYWNGPSFLNQPVDSWPINPTLQYTTEIPELKPNQHVLTAIKENSLMENICKFSTLNKLQNVFGYVRRFILNCKNPTSKIVGPLSASERKQALHVCASITQTHYFNEILVDMQRGKTLPTPFRKLTPFLDSTGLLRAGGRLQNSDLSYNAKHPILLPGNCHLASLLCDHYHRQLLHAGARDVQAALQTTWWIFSLRTLVRKRIFQCLKCYKLKAKTVQPFMGELPSVRTNRSRVFAHVGTDFCGPFLIKESRRRNSPITKCYWCIFICMAIKAVHIEVVTELSTAAFLASFDRFTSRRSLPTCVYSDRGTNYQGARNQIKAVSLWLDENQTTIFSQLAMRQVEWKFSPPNGPNFGGLWETTVKSAKTLLTRTVGSQPLTFEELNTLAIRIEGFLNSRPLTPLTATPDDGTDFLSPAHFLVGGTLIGAPEEQFSDSVPLHIRWNRLRQLTQAFWKRWSREYLQLLLPRPKWTEQRDNLKIGQLVYVSKLNTTPLSWPLGRITNTHPGKDGVIRVVTVKTSSGTYLRPVNTLIPLP